MILFKKQFYPAIRSGAKTTTLRYWTRRQVRPGSVHTVPRLGRLFVEDVREVQLAELDDDDARCDGFDSLDTLARALEDLYTPQQRQERTLYRIRFRYLSPTSPRQADPPEPDGEDG